MKIAIFTDNKYISSVDCNNIEEGNPGIGGSEFLAILLATLLCKRKQYECVLLTTSDGQFNEELNWVNCSDLEGAIEYYKRCHYDLILVDAKMLTKMYVWMHPDVHFVAWANTFISNDMLDFFADKDNVVSIVNVGKEQLEQTKNHRIYRKSTYIYNFVPQSILEKYKGTLVPNANRKHNVVYIGSLFHAKGFHLLAKAWKCIVKSVPDAHLYVIGGAKLYSRHAKLGKWGIASKQYESEFMPDLVDCDGKLLNSVHFLGILGNEKYDVIAKCKVGVPNPSGFSETFGITAVEMQMLDCLVTTMDCPGYKDTVCHKENLYEDVSDLANKVICLLQSSDSYYSDMLHYIERFNTETIIGKWNEFFQAQSLSLNSNLFVINKNRYLVVKGRLLYYFMFLKMRVKQFIKKIVANE